MGRFKGPLLAPLPYPAQPCRPAPGAEEAALPQACSLPCCERGDRRALQWGQQLLEKSELKGQDQSWDRTLLSWSSAQL